MSDLAERRRSAKPNGRALVATAFLIIALALYAAAAVTLAESLPSHQLVQGIYIAAAGLLWVWPAIRLIRWASRRH
ncbi:MAG: DUF2842 domain-containing protein [Alphaproteobacteria bacterium]